MIRSSLILLGVVIGLGLGVFYGWVISPVNYTDTAPAALRADYKDQYRILIASAYSADGDLDRARRRLSLLGDSDPQRTLTALAQRLAAENKNPSAVAALAAALGADVLTVTPVASPIPSMSAPTATDTPSPTPTPLPTVTPTATPIYDYTLLRQEVYCDDAERKPLIIVDVVDSDGKPLPGVKVVVTWVEGQDGFVTGLKPEISSSYGDFLMDAGTVYSVQVGSRTPPVNGLTAPPCASADGVPYPGAVRLVFQRK